MGKLQLGDADQPDVVLANALGRIVFGSGHLEEEEGPNTGPRMFISEPRIQAGQQAPSWGSAIGTYLNQACSFGFRKTCHGPVAS